MELPANCPRSTKRTFWKLNKTLNGLTRSARHWYTKISNHIVDDLGCTVMDQEKCVFKCTLIKGQPPIYVSLYVDDLIFYLSSDKVQEWFKNGLKSHLKFDSMGNTSWFLSQRYEWHNDEQGNISYHTLQQVMIKGMVEKNNISHCNDSQSP